MSETEKLTKAMSEDERIIAETIEKLTKIANRDVKVIVKDTAGVEDVTVKARILREPELMEYTRRLGEINPKLQTVKSFDELSLTPEENEKLNDLRDEFITRATGISKAALNQIGSAKIKTALFLGIIQASSPSQEDLSGIQKFR